MQQNDIYNIPLPRGPGPKKEDNERGINYPGWIKMLDSPRGHKISTRDSSVIMDRSSHGVFFLKEQTEVNYSFDHRARTASPPLPQSCQLSFYIVPSSTASTFVLAMGFGALSWRYGELKF
jgi:hypothetical protein